MSAACRPSSAGMGADWRGLSPDHAAQGGGDRAVHHRRAIAARARGRRQHRAGRGGRRPGGVATPTCQGSSPPGGRPGIDARRPTAPPCRRRGDGPVRGRRAGRSRGRAGSPWWRGRRTGPVRARVAGRDSWASSSSGGELREVDAPRGRWTCWCRPCPAGARSPARHVVDRLVPGRRRLATWSTGRRDSPARRGCQAGRAPGVGGFRPAAPPGRSPGGADDGPCDPRPSRRCGRRDWPSWRGDADG